VEAIEEINTTWSNSIGVRLTPIRWERDCRPGKGTDSQQVINAQLPREFDIFIGIFWKRFGTPTPRFASGTEEEFEAAYARSKAKSSRCRILVYFKDEAVPPSSLDAEQLKRVQVFKEKLPSRGILYWPFQSKEQFSQLVRIHLSKELQQFASGLSKAAKPQRRNGPQISLGDLKKRSQQYAEALGSLMLHHYLALDAHENDLKLSCKSKSTQDSIAIITNSLAVC